MQPEDLSSVQSLSHVQLFVTPWVAAYQASLSITISQSSLKLMSIQPPHPLLSPSPLPSIFLRIRVLSNELDSSRQVASGIGVSASASALLMNIQC